MKKILITGVSGYIAPYLCIELSNLIKKGAEYIAAGLYNSHSMNNENINFKIEFMMKKIENINKIEIFHKININIILLIILFIFLKI